MRFQDKVRAVFLAAVIVGNGLSLSGNDPASNQQVQQADFFGLGRLAKTGTKTKDSLGNWDGCKSGSPKNCLMISLPSLNINFSDEGIALD